MPMETQTQLRQLAAGKALLIRSENTASVCTEDKVEKVLSFLFDIVQRGMSESWNMAAQFLVNVGHGRTVSDRWVFATSQIGVYEFRPLSFNIVFTSIDMCKDRAAFRHLCVSKIEANKGKFKAVHKEMLKNADGLLTLFDFAKGKDVHSSCHEVMTVLGSLVAEFSLKRDVARNFATAAGLAGYEQDGRRWGPTSLIFRVNSVNGRPGIMHQDFSSPISEGTKQVFYVLTKQKPIDHLAASDFPSKFTSLAKLCASEPKDLVDHVFARICDFKAFHDPESVKTFRSELRSYLIESKNREFVEDLLHNLHFFVLGGSLRRSMKPLLGNSEMMQPGDMLFFDAFLLHATPAENSGIRGSLYSTWYEDNCFRAMQELNEGFTPRRPSTVILSVANFMDTFLSHFLRKTPVWRVDIQSNFQFDAVALKETRLRQYDYFAKVLFEPLASLYALFCARESACGVDLDFDDLFQQEHTTYRSGKAMYQWWFYKGCQAFYEKLIGEQEAVRTVNDAAASMASLALGQDLKRRKVLESSSGSQKRSRAEEKGPSGDEGRADTLGSL